jgi:hypothetical protein
METTCTLAEKLERELSRVDYVVIEYIDGDDKSQTWSGQFGVDPDCTFRLEGILSPQIIVEENYSYAEPLTTVIMLTKVKTIVVEERDPTWGPSGGNLSAVACWVRYGGDLLRFSR